MSYTNDMIQAYKSGHRNGYLKAIEDFEKLAEVKLPDEMRSAWEVMSLFLKEIPDDKKHRK